MSMGVVMPESAPDVVVAIAICVCFVFNFYGSVLVEISSWS